MIITKVTTVVTLCSNEVVCDWDVAHEGASGVAGNMSTWVEVIITFTKGFSNSAILIFKSNNHLFWGLPCAL